METAGLWFLISESTSLRYWSYAVASSQLLSNWRRNTCASPKYDESKNGGCHEDAANHA